MFSTAALMKWLQDFSPLIKLTVYDYFFLIIRAFLAMWAGMSVRQMVVPSHWIKTGLIAVKYSMFMKSPKNDYWWLWESPDFSIIQVKNCLEWNLKVGPECFFSYKVMPVEWLNLRLMHIQNIEFKMCKQLYYIAKLTYKTSQVLLTQTVCRFLDRCVENENLCVPLNFLLALCNSVSGVDSIKFVCSQKAPIPSWGNKKSWKPCSRESLKHFEDINDHCQEANISMLLILLV